MVAFVVRTIFRTSGEAVKRNHLFPGASLEGCDRPIFRAAENGINAPAIPT